jgi:hypothetical protein
MEKENPEKDIPIIANWEKVIEGLERSEQGKKWALEILRRILVCSHQKQ